MFSVLFSRRSCSRALQISAKETSCILFYRMRLLLIIAGLGCIAAQDTYRSSHSDGNLSPEGATVELTDTYNERPRYKEEPTRAGIKLRAQVNLGGGEPRRYRGGGEGLTGSHDSTRRGYPFESNRYSIFGRPRNRPSGFTRVALQILARLNNRKRYDQRYAQERLPSRNIDEKPSFPLPGGATVAETRGNQGTDFSGNVHPTDNPVKGQSDVPVSDQPGFPVPNQPGFPVTEQSNFPVSDQTGFPVTDQPTQPEGERPASFDDGDADSDDDDDDGLAVPDDVLTEVLRRLRQSGILPELKILEDFIPPTTIPPPTTEPKTELPTVGTVTRTETPPPATAGFLVGERGFNQGDLANGAQPIELVPAE